METPYDKRWTDTDGWSIRIFRRIENIWIEVSFPGKPAQSASAFSRYIDPVKIPAHVEGLRKQGKNPADYRNVSGWVVRAAAIPFVESVIADLEAERKQAATTLRQTVPGLDELRAAVDDESRYAEQFQRMMDDGNNDGARPPRPVATKASDVAARFPVAAAYQQAESWASASNYAKASAGKKAKARIAAGEDYNLVLAEMDAEWSAHVEEHVWD